MLLAFYILVGEKQGVGPEKLAGTLQADILKEFIAQKEYIYPPRPSMRIVVDMIRYCTERMPKWNTISISGYHIREAGATAAQELAFTLRDGIEYVQWCVDAGHGRGQLRPAPLLLLQLAQRLLRGDREVPRGAADLGAHDAGALRGEEPALVDAALPHPDGGGEPHRAAALQQRRAHGAPGPRRRPRRDAVAPHQLARRGARAARPRRR